MSQLQVSKIFWGKVYIILRASSADCSDIKHVTIYKDLHRVRRICSQTLGGSYITRRSHRVSAWTPSQLRSQYGIAHRRHLYNPQYPQTEQIIRGGYAEGGAPAVRYVGTLDGKDAML